VPAQDVAALAAAMRRPILDREPRRRPARPAPRTVWRFQMQTIVAQWDALIREVVAKAREAGAARAPEPAPVPFE
jgi:hypothetical protein